MALQGFGGVLTVAQVELVERRRWLSRMEFLEMFSAAQVLPGPNIINLALFLGDRWFGLRGALAATAGLLLAPCALVLLLAALYQHWQHVPAVAGALRGMAAVSAGLVLGTALRLAPALQRNVMGLRTSQALAATALLCLAWARWPLAGVVLGLGPVGMALAWWRLKRRA